MYTSYLTILYRPHLLPQDPASGRVVAVNRSLRRDLFLSDPVPVVAVGVPSVPPSGSALASIVTNSLDICKDFPPRRTFDCLVSKTKI